MTRRQTGTGSIWVEPRVRGDVYVGQIRVNNEQKQRVLGPVRKAGTRDGLSRAQAEKALREFRAEVERNVNVAPATRHVSLEEVAEQHCSHLETVLNRRPQTVQDYRIIVRKHLVPFFFEPMSGITTHHVQAFFRQQIDSGLAHGTVANQANLLNAIFVYALKRGVVTSNPVTAADKPRAASTNTDIRFLTMGEVERVIACVDDTVFGQVERVLFLTAAMTGLRQGELLALRWQDVDLDAHLLRVRLSYTRGRVCKPKSRTSERAVPLASRVVSALRTHRLASAYATEEDLVFCHPHTGRYYVSTTLLDRFKQAATRARVLRPGIVFHSFRHTYATAMASAGVPLVALQRWLGHADIATTMIYAAWTDEGDAGRTWADRAFNGETTADSDDEAA